MFYRRSAQLALQASILLAVEPAGNCRRVRELAEALAVPATYLAKVLQSLTWAGLLHAVRGPGGGVQLAHPARQTSLWDIVTAVEPVGEMRRCLLGIGQCGDANPCALHEQWAPIRTRLLDMLEHQTLGDLASEAVTRGLIVRNENSAWAFARRSSPERRKGS